MCTLATEFNFTEKLAGIPGGGGSNGVLRAHRRGTSLFLGWRWQVWLCHLSCCPEAGLLSFP